MVALALMPDLDDGDEGIEAGEFETDAGEKRYYPRGSEDAEQSDWLARELGRKVRYNYSSKSWHAWNGLIWAPDKTKDVQEKVYALARQRLTDLALSRNMGETKRAAAMKITRRLLDQARCESALAVLATQKDYKTDGSDWDQIPHLLGCKNGIVDLRDGSLDTEPSPDCLVTKSTGIDYIPDAEAERFTRFLYEITSNDEQLVSFFILWFGYSLFGLTEEQRFLIMAGLGRNGKGALATVVRKVFGDYSAPTASSLYMKSRFGTARSNEARADLIALKGSRLAIMSEPEGGQFNEEMLKAHTGGDPIVARTLHSSVQVEWVPTHSITFLTNKPPAVDDIGPAMAARVMVADFRERYEGEKEDKGLYAKLLDEKEGILAILVAGAVMWWSRRDSGGLELPQRVIDASRAYISANDPIGRVLDEAFVIEQGARTQAQLVYETYTEWHARSDEEEGAMSQTAFATALRARGFVKSRGRQANYYIHLRPKSAAEVAGDEE